MITIEPAKKTARPGGVERGSPISSSDDDDDTDNGGTMKDKINLAQKPGAFDENFSPKIVGELNDYKLEIVKVTGRVRSHSHPDADDSFLGLAGRLTIQLRNCDIELGPGELCVVLRGTEHISACPPWMRERTGAIAGYGVAHSRRLRPEAVRPTTPRRLPCGSGSRSSR